MKLTMAPLALLAPVLAAQEVSIRNFFITAKGDLEKGEFRAYWTEFYIGEDDFICGTNSKTPYPTDRVTHGCFTATANDDIFRDWDFSVEGVTADNHTATLTIWNKEESPEKTGSGLILLQCRRNGHPGDGLDWIVCQQQEPATVTLI